LTDAAQERCLDELIRGFNTYERAVDVVSAFEFLHLGSKGLPSTVRHFERFPRLVQDGFISTPDFTIVFKDGSGLAAEIARIALHENSVESLCRQLMRYDSLTRLPSNDGVVDVGYCDVLLLVPFELGIETTRRVLHERFADAAHWYAPSVAPCVVQFGLDQGRWIFQRISDPLNGVLREDGRPDGIGAWFAENSIKVQPERVAAIKAARAFMNDPVDQLYLATHLWARTFATMVSQRVTDTLPAILQVTVDELTEHVRRHYGRVRRADVRRAMRLLQAAKLTEAVTDTDWQLAWYRLQVPGERDLSRAIARRVCDPPRTTRLDALRKRGELKGDKRPPLGQGRLFNAGPSSSVL
jgi:hypothetical protein